MRVHDYNPDGGAVLVLLSGYMFGEWTFRPMQRLMDDVRFVIFEDVGVANTVTTGGCHLAAIKAIEAELAQRGINEFHLAGHSMGGFVAQELAAAHPEGLKSLALLGSCHLKEFRQSDRVNALPVLDALFNLEPDAFFRFSVHNIFSAAFLADQGCLSALRTDFDLNLADRERCRDQLHMLGGLFETGGRYGYITLPCLAVYGGLDTIVRPEWVHKLEPHFLMEPEFRAVPSSHMFMYERPRETAEVLREWITRCE